MAVSRRHILLTVLVVCNMFRVWPGGFYTELYGRNWHGHICISVRTYPWESQVGDTALRLPAWRSEEDEVIFSPTGFTSPCVVKMWLAQLEAAMAADSGLMPLP